MAAQPVQVVHLLPHMCGSETAGPTRAVCMPRPQDRLGFSPAELSPIDVSEPAAARPEVQVPPYTGIGVGSPEDSIQNCLRLIPKPPKKDQYRWQQLVGLGAAGCWAAWRAAWRAARLPG